VGSLKVLIKCGDCCVPHMFGRDGLFGRKHTDLT